MRHLNKRQDYNEVISFWTDIDIKLSALSDPNDFFEPAKAFYNYVGSILLHRILLKVKESVLENGTSQSYDIHEQKGVVLSDYTYDDVRAEYAIKINTDSNTKFLLRWSNSHQSHHIMLLLLPEEMPPGYRAQYIASAEIDFQKEKKIDGVYEVVLSMDHDLHCYGRVDHLSCIIQLAKALYPLLNTMYNYEESLEDAFGIELSNACRVIDSVNLDEILFLAERITEKCSSLALSQCLPLADYIIEKQVAKNVTDETSYLSYEDREHNIFAINGEHYFGLSHITQSLFFDIDAFMLLVEKDGNHSNNRTILLLDISNCDKNSIIKIISSINNTSSSSLYDILEVCNECKIKYSVCGANSTGVLYFNKEIKEEPNKSALLQDFHFMINLIARLQADYFVIRQYDLEGKGEVSLRNDFHELWIK